MPTKCTFKEVTIPIAYATMMCTLCLAQQFIGAGLGHLLVLQDSESEACLSKNFHLGSCW